MRRAGEGMFIVAETTLRYLKPARLDDQLTVTVAVTEIGRASVTFAQEGLARRHLADPGHGAHRLGAARDAA